MPRRQRGPRTGKTLLITKIDSLTMMTFELFQMVTNSETRREALTKLLALNAVDDIIVKGMAARQEVLERQPEIDDELTALRIVNSQNASKVNR